MLDFFSGQIGSLAQNNDCGHQLSPFLIRDAEYCRFLHFGDLVNSRLDFARVDIFSTADDHLFGSIDDEEVAVLVLPADISGVKEPATQCFGGFVHRGTVVPEVFLDVVPITPHDAWPPRYEISEFAGGYRRTDCIDNSQIGTRRGRTERLKLV